MSLSCEGFYGNGYGKLTEARKALDALAGRLKAGGCRADGTETVLYHSSRIKDPESMARKLASRGFPVTPESALENVYDALGIRIVCSFQDDVRSVVETLEREPSLEIREKKDYLARPKANGYRSVHLCVYLKDFGVPAEIQVRTIAMDFWASLEHQLAYRKDTPGGDLIRSELKRCADEIASVDLSLETIREILEENEKSFPGFKSA